LRLKAGEHHLIHPLEIDKPLSLIGESSGNTRVLCDGEAHVVGLVGDGPFVLHELSFEHEGSLWAHVVEVAGGEIDIRRCRFSGGVGVVGDARAGDGLFLRNQTRGLVANCESVQNEHVGISVNDQAQPTLEANACQGNRVDGISVNDQAQPTMETNTCQGNGNGIGYLGSAAGAARHNTCRANEGDGIVIIGQAKPVLEGNTVSDNDENGIFVGGEAHPTLEANTCQGNKLMGIGYGDSAAGTARHNVCSANGSGIGLVEQAHPTLEANTCQENLQYGIIYLDNAAGVARNNVCSLNKPDDLYVEPPAHPVLQENRTGSPEPQTAQTGSQTERTLYEVALPKGAILFQAGAKHYFGDSQLTITNRRLILQSPEGIGQHGGDQQVLLRDIVNVSRQNQLFNRGVLLEFSNPTISFLLYCKKGDIGELASMIEEARAMV